MNSKLTLERVWRRGGTGLWLAAGLLGLGACTTTQVVDLDADDDHVLFTDGRLTWDLEAKPQTKPGTEPTQTGGISLEVLFSHGEGEDQVSLRPGQAIVLGGELFRGENTAFFDLTRVLVSLRSASSSRDDVSAALIVGLEYTSVDVTMREPGLPGFALEGRDKVTAIGPSIGGALVWQPSGGLSVFAEARAGFGLSPDATDIESYSLDLGVRFLSSERVGLSCGWRTVSYEAELDRVYLSGLGSSASALDLRLSGPVISLNIKI